MIGDLGCGHCMGRGGVSHFCRCPKCGNFPAKTLTPTIQCPTCNGSNRVKCRACFGTGHNPRTLFLTSCKNCRSGVAACPRAADHAPCPTCKGLGGDPACSQCNGTGHRCRVCGGRGKLNFEKGLGGLKVMPNKFDVGTFSDNSQFDNQRFEAGHAMGDRDLDRCITGFLAGEPLLQIRDTQLALLLRDRASVYIYRVGPSQYVAVLHRSGIDASYSEVIH